MNLPDDRPLVLDAGILAEPSPPGRVVLWVPTAPRDGTGDWERVATAAGAAVVTDRGIRSVAAAAIPAGRREGSAWSRFVRRLSHQGGEQTWTLPDGSAAVARGPRRSDAVLAWSDGVTLPLSDASIWMRWPEAQGIRRLGPDLRLVVGVERGRAEPGPGIPPAGSARAVAEAALVRAREAGDCPRAVTAMSDLGMTHLHDGDHRAAIGVLEAAIAEARGLGDQAREADVAINLALARLRSGEPGRARDLLVAVLTQARSAGDRHAETLALDRLANALSDLGDPAGALSNLERAAAVAAETGDLRREADALWRSAILLAEGGRRDRAIAAAAASVDRLRRLEHPAVDWFASHLENYRSGAPFAPTMYPPGASPMKAPPTPTGPGLLRMALTATESMAKFVGSGFKRATPETYRERLSVCAGCEHHTGVRCRICGCLTAVKAGALHERCPANRWPVGPSDVRIPQESPVDRRK